MVIDERALSELGAKQLCEVTQRLLAELRHQRALNKKLTYKCTLLKQLKFATQSEWHSADQRNLLEEELDRDLAVVSHDIEQLRPAQPATDKQQPKRVGVDVAEKLDYVPGVFTMERHTRDKWACAQCQTLTQAPVGAQGYWAVRPGSPRRPT